MRNGPMSQWLGADAESETPPVRSRDPLRRVILVVLAIYLAPALLAALMVGGVAMAGLAIGRAFGFEFSPQHPDLARWALENESRREPLTVAAAEVLSENGRLGEPHSEAMIR